MQFQEEKGEVQRRLCPSLSRMERQATKQGTGAQKGCVTCPRLPTKLIPDPGPGKGQEGSAATGPTSTLIPAGAGAGGEPAEE